MLINAIRDKRCYPRRSTDNPRNYYCKSNNPRIIRPMITLKILTGFILVAYFTYKAYITYITYIIYITYITYIAYIIYITYKSLITFISFYSFSYKYKYSSCT